MIETARCGITRDVLGFRRFHAQQRDDANRWLIALLGFCLTGACSTNTLDAPSGAGGSGGVVLGGLGGSASAPTRSCHAGTWDCQKVDCPADSVPSTTSISGVVYDPAGRVPLYNAVVYVAQEESLPQLGTSAACESCSANFPTENVWSVTLSKADGSFRLTDVPAGKQVPVVIQLGKWRRLLHVDVPPCTNTPLPAELTRLPRNASEGNLPKIAVTTGGSDALECLVQKIGVDLSEFTPDNGDGHVHLFSGFAAAKSMNVDGKSQALRPAEELWANSQRMLDYDMMLMGCEGDDNLWGPEADLPSGALPRPVSMQLEVRKYADLGGRIFGSHWHHRWINSDDTTPDAPYPLVAHFAKSAKDIGDVTVAVDDTFPKGAAFRDWLVNVKASATPGELAVVKAEHSVDSVDSALARRWIYGTDPGGKVGGSRVPDMVQYFSFTTPVGEPECGRMVFSDVHVSFGGGDDAATPFPERCDASPDSELSAQEKALEFMIFDLSSCIQKEDADVSAPITVVK